MKGQVLMMIRVFFDGLTLASIHLIKEARSAVAVSKIAGRPEAGLDGQLKLSPIAIFQNSARLFNDV